MEEPEMYPPNILTTLTEVGLDLASKIAGSIVDKIRGLTSRTFKSESVR